MLHVLFNRLTGFFYFPHRSIFIADDCPPQPVFKDVIIRAGSPSFVFIPSVISYKLYCYFHGGPFPVPCHIRYQQILSSKLEFRPNLKFGSITLGFWLLSLPRPLLGYPIVTHLIERVHIDRNMFDCT